MRTKTEKLLYLLNSALTEGDKKLSELMSIAEKGGFKKGYVRVLCDTHFFKSGRGLFSLRDTGYKARRVRLGYDDLRRIAQSAVLNRAVRLDEKKVRKLAIKEGITTLPKNVSLAIAKEFVKSYDELLEAASEPKKKEPGQELESSFEDGLNKLLERHSANKGTNIPCSTLTDYLSGCLKVFLGVQKKVGDFSLMTEKDGVVSTVITHTPSPPSVKRPPPVKVLIASLLQSQIAEFQRRPKIKAQVECGRLSLSFIAQGRTAYDLPVADHCVIMKMTSHKLWDKMVAQYGRANVSLVNGIHSMEDKVISTLFKV